MLAGRRDPACRARCRGAPAAERIADRRAPARPFFFLVLPNTFSTNRKMQLAGQKKKKMQLVYRVEQ
jgi:hypothetical protein